MRTKRRLRALAATLSPLAAFSLERTFWPSIQPFAWLLFYPAVFISSWIGGLAGGLWATFVSTGLVWWYFLPPEHSLVKETPKSFLLAGIFVVMGILFSLFNDRLRRANRRAEAALGLSRTANEELQRANERGVRLYERVKELDERKTRLFAGASKVADASTEISAAIAGLPESSLEAQGGKIWAESVSGRTTFHFTLPRREPRAVETHGAARGAIDAAVR